jgi:hypothetical protein
MNKRLLLIVGGLVGLIIVGVVGWWLISPIFVDRTVDEEFPVALSSPETAAQVATPEPTPTVEPTATVEEVAPDVTAAEATAPTEVPTATEVPPTEVPLTPTPSGPVALSLGQFQDGERNYEATGTATLYQLPDGSHLLRFEEFEATNGPDLRVLLVTNPNPTSSADKGEFIDLGELKGNVGNQNYEIAADVDLSQYQSVIIYCRAFSALFASAPLTPAT